MSNTSIRLSKDIDQPLESLARKMDRSKNYLINQAIREYLIRQSQEESRWEDTRQALESIQAGHSVDESEVNAWLNSWGTANRRKTPGT